ncbi:MAG TPA: helix-turn-helix transcriptional regulator [Candidatus Acidoferrales bacterium]|nr:helix-turn-helix transcriptional regulator [Candidatus Acidoferrales bacterium]
MDIASVIRHRLDELGIGQRELAVAAEVTESYVSQLLAKKKTPPAPDRTDIYDKIAKVLKIPSKELARLAETQRREELKRKVLDPPRPLFQEFRQLILRKCVATKRKQITNIFDREPFGEFERFITQKLLDLAKRVARVELEDEEWIHRVARVGKRSYEETRVLILEFLDTDVFHVSVENCVSFLEPLIESWDIDFEDFGMEIVLNRRLTRKHLKKLEYREAEPEPIFEMEPGLKEFLEHAKLSAGITEHEITFLKSLRPNGKRPSVLYYYRELQNLRDPLNFLPLSIKIRRGSETKTSVAKPSRRKTAQSRSRRPR